MKKVLLLSALFGLMSGAALAEGAMHIHQREGGVVITYGFDEKPVVTYQNGALHVETVEFAMDYPLAELYKITFTDGTSAIGQLRVSKSSEDVRVYSLDGKLLLHVPASEGAASFNVLDLPAGNYIVRQGAVITKILKR